MLGAIKLSVTFPFGRIFSEVTQRSLENLHVTLGSFTVKVCLMGMAPLYIWDAGFLFSEHKIGLVQ